MPVPNIVRDPKILFGKPTIAGTRISVEMILQQLAAGFSELEREMTANLPEYMSPTATALLAAYREQEDAGILPILADAMQDAGCDNALLLKALRECETGVADLLTGETLRGEEAVYVFGLLHDGGLIGQPAGKPCTSDYLNERVQLELENARHDYADRVPEIAFDGKELDVAGETFYLESVTGYEGEAVACRGDHYGSEWGASCPEIDTYDLAQNLATRELLDLIVEIHRDNVVGAELATIGLGSIDDPTDDGDNFIVSGEAKFLAFANACATLTESGELEYSTGADAEQELFDDAQSLLSGQTIAEIVASYE